MSRPRGRLGHQVLLAAAGAATTWTAMNAWRSLTVDAGGFLNPLLLLALVVAAIGVATRWWRWPGPVVVGTQLVAATVLGSLLLTGSVPPVAGAWPELTALIRDAVDSSRLYAAPVPTDAPPVDPLLILGGAACLVLVDALACTARRVPLAGLPLLAIFSIPVGMVGSTVPSWVFAGTAGGFLAMLYLQGAEQTARWGRPIGEDRETGDPISFGAGSRNVRGTAGLVGGAATALAVLVPVLVPATGWHVFDVGPGSGGDDKIVVDNPVADLVRDFKGGEDFPLLRITTEDPEPSYLRILTLTRFSAAEWSPGNRDVPSDQLADGQMPPLEGVSVEVSRRSYPYEVTVSPRFESRWLPTQDPVTRVEATGDWRYDLRTMDFLAGDKEQTTSGLQYTMTAVDLDLDSARLADASPPGGKVDDLFTQVPDDLPEIVGDLAREVTEGATTEYEKAVALQRWFRQDGGFQYTLAGADGSGFQALVDFLTQGPGGRQGYCEQFAASMAAMARVLGIPARVAIGFLRPDPAGPDTWIYSARDMHAWPELYFDGAGWVRFEPTPSGRTGQPPAWTIPGAGGDQEPTAEPSASASSSAALPSAQNRPTEEAGATDAEQAEAGTSVAWVPLVAGGAALVLVLVALLLPRGVRRRRRAQRLSLATPEAAWDELRDTAIDLGAPWPADRSPRETRDVVVDLLGHPVSPDTPDRPAHGREVAPAAVEALDRIVLAVELGRYAATTAPGDPVRLRADVEGCVAALAGGATRSARRHADWWPRSVFVRRPRSQRPEADERRTGGVLDRVG